MTVRFVKYDRYLWMGKQPKLTLTFQVIDFGEHFEKEIQAHYRLTRYDGRGRCYAPKCSRIVRDFGRLFPDYVNEQPLPLARLKDVVAVARTRLVTCDGDGVPLAEQQKYLVVDHMRGLSDDH